MLLASQTVQVTTEAKASPTMTAFTTMSAEANIDHGDKSRGRCTAPITPTRCPAAGGVGEGAGSPGAGTVSVAIPAGGGAGVCASAGPPPSASGAAMHAARSKRSAALLARKRPDGLSVSLSVMGTAYLSGLLRFRFVSAREVEQVAAPPHLHPHLHP